MTDIHQRLLPIRTVKDAISIRNESWSGNPLIPKWVNQEEVGLDCFYTPSDVARECSESLYSIMQKDGVDTENYHFIDPSVGTGSFYNLMPENRRTGIDVLPSHPEFIGKDYLTWLPNDAHQKQYAVLGNPPFGYRAWLALAFLNHSAIYADYIGFILPMAFQSDGKGSPKFRVKGAELVLSTRLSCNDFVDISGDTVKLNTLWQIWRRGINRLKAPKTCNNWVDLFTVDTRKERLCGQNRMQDADYFLQRTFYGEPPRIVRDFSQVRYACGYGIILKSERDKIKRLLNNIDWRDYSNLAVHNCRHISMYHIHKAITDGGFIDA
ncbi:MAG: hypothetical protein OXH00_17890 [Candidatus Poribacteria bacterium]|nr:hypothetical protein [Candidatus Poribacteria bacterium]